MPINKKTAKKVVDDITKVAGIVETSVKHGKTGSEVVKTTVQPLREVPKVYANVGVTASRTINLGDFNNVKVGVSIHMPCDPKGVDACYEDCLAWVDKRMATLTEEHDGGSQPQDD
jgi:hypothetical protein